MSGLDMLRRQVDRRALGALGRTSHRTRTYDVEVRADAANLDVVRLPVDVNSVVSLQDEQGAFRMIAGLTPIGEGSIR